MRHGQAAPRLAGNKVGHLKRGIVINKWISNDRAHVTDGLAGSVTELQGAEAWTKMAIDSLAWTTWSWT